jgi:hypothetical protein
MLAANRPIQHRAIVSQTVKVVCGKKMHSAKISNQREMNGQDARPKCSGQTKEAEL